MEQIHRLRIYGSPAIGVFVFANDELAIVPPDIGEKELSLIEKELKVSSVAKTKIGGSVVIGVLVAGNNHGILVPRTILDDELEELKRHVGDLNVLVLESRENALGNLVLANDKGAVVYPHFSKKVLKQIEDVLGVEVEVGFIGKSPLTGSCGVANNNGVVISVNAFDDEVELVESVLKVPASLSSVNGGTTHIRSGLVANNKGFVVGEETTGPELARIVEGLGFG